jgi:pimeloyl-ACP methyl ester carboxylesterase
MSNAPIVAAPIEPAAWAEVRAHDRVVRYRRSGAGPAVLLLQPASSSTPLWPEVLEVLADGRRVIVPDPPANDGEAEEWLSALLEGLGVRNIIVVATDSFCLAALERALLSPEQIARMIMICSGRGTESAIDGKLAAPAQSAAIPFLVLRRDRPASEIVPVVEAFLRR